MPQNSAPAGEDSSRCGLPRERWLRRRIAVRRAGARPLIPKVPLARCCARLALAGFAPVAATTLAAGALAQGTGGGEAPRVVTPALEFGGVIFANYQQRGDSVSRAANSGHNSSRFDVERVYLNFRMPAGERASIRVTTDLFVGDQSGSSYYRGWTMRLKYAFAQWTFAQGVGGVTGLDMTARFGMIANPVIELEDTYWQRYLSQNSAERSGQFFSSADIGAGLTVALPKRMGELHAAVLNGPGYTAAENDRFKDVVARLSLTPFASSTTLGGWSRSFVVSPWVYAGSTSSRFRAGGTGQVGAVDDALTRDRYGVLIAARDPRLTAGFSVGSRTETVESGDNTPSSPRTARDVTGTLVAGFAMVRPGAWHKPGTAWARWGVLHRTDRFTASRASNAGTDLHITSLFWEPTSRITLSLDRQDVRRRHGSTAPELKGTYLHLQATF